MAEVTLLKDGVGFFEAATDYVGMHGNHAVLYLNNKATKRIHADAVDGGELRTAVRRAIEYDEHATLEIDVTDDA